MPFFSAAANWAMWPYMEYCWEVRVVSNQCEEKRRLRRSRELHGNVHK